ncbi:MAG TPA: bifunctional shikimate kinase/3-dehydroquinate synthase [Gaiellaceae bacterium]|nr:bifunctional shikimate kinase/3-dehydroquinate synthase [Gaiellaceae bacterium]
MAAPHALNRHVALVGFMGAGQTTLGPILAERLGRGFVSVDAVVEERTGATVAELFETRGEPAFRALEEAAATDLLARTPSAVLELGGGALGSEATRAALSANAFTLHLDVSVDEAWSRVAGSGRPLAQDGESFRARYDERRTLYAEAADGAATDADGAVLAAAGIRFAPHAEAGGAAVVADPVVVELHGVRATHLVSGKAVADAERLWRELDLERGHSLVAVGGGTTTDVAGFVAATTKRGVDWVAVPSTLVGQVDAAIGGKTGIDLPEGKNLVGAFHWPRATVIDVALLETLPEEEWRNGLAEVVKTGLLAGEQLWELEPGHLVRACAAYKAALCLRDPYERGERAYLNLGHTFGHALEAASGYTISHGRAVALGLLAALRLSGVETEPVEEVLAPEPVAVDPERAWAALHRDKKVRDGRVNLVLLEEPGRPYVAADLEPALVRAALEALIA